MLGNLCLIGDLMCLLSLSVSLFWEASIRDSADTSFRLIWRSYEFTDSFRLTDSWWDIKNFFDCCDTGLSLFNLKFGKVYFYYLMSASMISLRLGSFPTFVCNPKFGCYLGDWYWTTWGCSCWGLTITWLTSWFNDVLDAWCLSCRSWDDSAPFSSFRLDLCWRFYWNSILSATFCSSSAAIVNSGLYS